MKEEELKEFDNDEGQIKNKHWQLLSNVWRGVVLFKQSEVSVVEDIGALIEDVRSNTHVSYVEKDTYGETASAIIEYRLTEKLFEYLMRGSTEDLEKITELIEKDPRRFVRLKTNTNSLLNRSNPSGVRPIVEAARHGHYIIVDLLIKEGADPSLPSKAGPFEQENALEVACRWSYPEIVKLLLKKHHWSAQELKFARKVTTNPRIDKALSAAMPKNIWSCLICR